MSGRKNKLIIIIIITLIIAFIITLLVLGDPRTNQNPALLSFGILFFRWHNVIADRIQKKHPEWSDEQVFHNARRYVIASLQVILRKFFH